MMMMMTTVSGDRSNTATSFHHLRTGSAANPSVCFFCLISRRVSRLGWPVETMHDEEEDADNDDDDVMTIKNA